ncbi:imidazole glycerol phosphate synthase subunit HisH [Clostridium sp.]|uniref:imidazole glycerol phosphate synthase subunit HisH n=1 Tax=Clostridium sp. TaxID=1506 RepID=UPI0028470A70|nr:imidazole glycerol phosphate synthase subunit HisH [Clostridium sp.]MDR3598763.1 imidazole glycerol phosphate synthase subunit HisH [Clostridium sp.]
MKKVAIIDYGMGNLDSVKRAIEECGGNAFITKNPKDLNIATHIILPGVGSFYDGMNNFLKSGYSDELREQAIHNRIPILGICLGMQILADTGYEIKETQGLGLIHGIVKKFQPKNGERVPHVGWNEINILAEHPLIKNIKNGSNFYFVHSYYFSCTDKTNVIATTDYCSNFASVIVNDNIMGTQFHPEKSQKTGFQLLNNFLAL